MKRREFITLLGGAATASIAWPFDARGQQAGKVIRIGFIGASLNSPAVAAQYQAFLTELHELGFSEGRNIIVDYRRVDDPRGPFAVDLFARQRTPLRANRWGNRPVRLSIAEN